MVLKEEHDKRRRRRRRRRKGVDNIYREISKASLFFASQEIEILVSGLRIRSLMGLGAPYLHHRRRGGQEGGQSRSVRTAKSGVNGNCWKSQICVIGLLDSWIAACTAGLPYTSACGCYVILLFANFSSKLPLK